MMNTEQDNLLKISLEEKGKELHITEIAKLFPTLTMEELVNHLEGSTHYTSSYGGLSGFFYRLSFEYRIKQFIKDFPNKDYEELYERFLREYKDFPLDLKGFKKILMRLYEKKEISLLKRGYLVTFS